METAHQRLNNKKGTRRSAFLKTSDDFSALVGSSGSVDEDQARGRDRLEACDLVGPVAGCNLAMEQRVQRAVFGDDVEALVPQLLLSLLVGLFARLLYLDTFFSGFNLIMDLREPPA